MAQTLVSDYDAVRQHVPCIGLVVRVWRVVGGVPLGLFTYAGDADAAVLHAVMQVVRRLTAAVPGDWRVEVVGAGLEGALLRALEHDLGQLRVRGLRPRLALAPRLRPELTALLRARPAALAAQPAEQHH